MSHLLVVVWSFWYLVDFIHWNGYVVILTKFSPQVALEVAEMRIPGQLVTNFCQNIGILFEDDNYQYSRWRKFRRGDHIAGLVVNYGISNTIVLDIPQFTTKTAISPFHCHLWCCHWVCINNLGHMPVQKLAVKENFAPWCHQFVFHNFTTI